MTYVFHKHQVWVFLISLVSSFFLTYIMIHLARRIKLTDHPDTNKFHLRETPLGGGCVMFFSMLSILVFPEMRTSQTYVIVIAAFLLTVLGLIDDYHKLSGAYKFILLVVITLVCSRFNILATTTRILPVDLSITILWMVGISSAFNAIDNMDGLAAGVAAIASFFFFIVAYQTNQLVFGGLSLSLAGACLGFLFFNFHPAKIFMGNSGSFFLGYILAALGVMGKWHKNEIIASSIPILILGLPIFDISFTVLWRHFTGVTRSFTDALNHCGTDHTSHRLVTLGIGKRRAVLLLYLVAASFGISATTLREAGPLDALLLLLQAFFIATALALIITITHHFKKE